MKIISSIILVFVALIYSNACSKPNDNNVTKEAKTTIENNASALIVSAIIDSVIDPITIQVIENKQKTVVKLLGLAIPELSSNTTMYDFALHFTKFHLDKGKEIHLQKDRYSTNQKSELRYLFVDGEMYNKLMLTNGYAIVSNTPAQFEFKKEFKSIEQQAQDSHLGYWENKQNERLNGQENTNINESNKNKPAGTLPIINPSNLSNKTCDFTKDDNPVIKGNFDKNTKIKTYYLPDSIFYKTIVINVEDGDKFICTEKEAQSSGWVKSKH